MAKRLFCALGMAVVCLAVPTLAAASDPTLAGFSHSNAMPIGDKWELPAGVSFARQIMGHTMFFEENCDPDPEKVVGSGDAVMLCLPLTYRPEPGMNPSLPIFIVLPAGLIFTSEDENFQHGIVVKSVTIQIRPGQTIHVPVGLMCMNAGRSTSAPGVAYRLGPVTRNPGFQRLFALLENKRTRRPS